MLWLRRPARRAVMRPPTAATLLTLLLTPLAGAALAQGGGLRGPGAPGVNMPTVNVPGTGAPGVAARDAVVPGPGTPGPGTPGPGIPGPGTPGAGALTPAQRAEVVGILRDALRADPSLLRDALAALQADDDRRRDGAQSDVLMLLAGKLVDPADPIAGNPLAAVTLVEFYDTRCPYCRRLMATTDELLRTDPGVRIVFKDLPILGAASRLESVALLAAQRQGGYLRLQAAVMRAGIPPTRDTLREEAERQGLDGAALLRDMDDPALKARLDANVALAQQIGLQGTPALVIGTRLIPGAVDLADLRAAVADARAGR